MKHKRMAAALLAAGAALGIARAADLAWFTNKASGLCTAGPVWLRYLLLAGFAVLAALAGARARPAGAAALAGPNRPAAGAAALGMVYTAFSAVAALWAGGMALTDLVLRALCALWLGMLALSWYRRPWRGLAGGAAGGVAGTLLFCWQVLSCFMHNSSSWYRVGPTLYIFSVLAVLVFCTALLRALLLPHTADSRLLCRSGLWAFYFGLCADAPQAVAGWLFGWDTFLAHSAHWPLWGAGVLGAVCAWQCLCAHRRPASPGESQ